MATRPAKFARTGTLAIENLETTDIFENLDRINALNNLLSLKLLAVFKVLNLNLLVAEIDRVPLDLQNLIQMMVIDPKKAILDDKNEEDIKRLNEIVERIQKVAQSCFFEIAVEKLHSHHLEEKNKKALNEALSILEKLPMHFRSLFLSVKNTNKWGIRGYPEFGSTLLQLALLEKEDEVALKILKLLNEKNRKSIILMKNIRGLNAFDMAKNNEKLLKDMVLLLSEEDRNELLGMKK